MKHTVYVPQGCSARLTRFSLNHDIEALYTDGFSTCNIIVCLGDDKIALMHADQFTPPERIKEELDWVRQGDSNESKSEFILIHRTNERIIADHIVEFFRKKVPNININIKEMDTNSDGVYVSFSEQKESDIHQKIKKYPIRERPNTLLHHPDEQKFLTVQKMRAIIGVRARLKTNKHRLKNHNIFDGYAWEFMEDYYFTVDASHELTRKEMAFFNKNDPYVIIIGKVAGLAQEAMKVTLVLEDLNEFSQSIAFFIESYLNDYQYELPFKRNFTELLANTNNLPRLNPVSVQDVQFKEILSQALEKENAFDEVTAVINSAASKKLPESAFKKSVLEEYKIFAKHYCERKHYADLEKTNKTNVDLGVTASQKAVEEFNKNNVKGALALFLEMIKQFTYTCLKNDINLAKAYHSYGRCLMKLNDYKNAKIYLEYGFDLKKTYFKASKDEIEKTKKALDECEKYLTIANAQKNQVQSKSLAM